MKRDYDSTVARIAGNILSGLVSDTWHEDDERLIIRAVKAARGIIEETKRTEPAEVLHKVTASKDSENTSQNS